MSLINNQSLDAKHRRIQYVNIIVLLLILFMDGSGIQVINSLNPSIMEGLGIDKPTLANITIVQLGSAFVFSLVASAVIGKLTAKWTLAIGMVGMVLLQGAWGLQLPYEAMLGFAIAGGLCLAWGSYSAVQGIMASFFGGDASKIYGLMAGCQQLFGALATFVAGQMLLVMPYTNVLLVFSVTTLVVCILFIVFVPQPDEEFEAMRRAEEEKKLAAAKEKAAEQGLPGYTLKEMLKRPSLWLFAVAMFTGSIITSGMNSWSSTLFTMFGMTKTDASTMTSLYLLFSAIHFMYYGFLQKKAGSRIFVTIMYCGVLCGMVLLAVWTLNASMIWLAAVSLFFVAFIKPVNSLPNLIVPGLAGPKDLAAIYMFLFGVYYAGSLFSNFSTSRILQFIGGTPAMIYLGAMAIVALVCLHLAIKVSPYAKLQKQECEK